MAGDGMSAGTGAVLASIDGALTAYGATLGDESVPDGMRWMPEPVKDEEWPPPEMPPQVTEAVRVAREEETARLLRRVETWQNRAAAAALMYAALVAAAVMVPLPHPLAWIMPGAVTYGAVIFMHEHVSRRCRKLIKIGIRESRAPVPDVLRCPSCGHDTFTDFAALTLESAEPGKWGVCLTCGEIAVFGRRGHLRAARDPELQAIIAHMPQAVLAAITAVRELRRNEES
jgi:hypothetical protein